jgi:hypothetical protein
MQLNKKSRIEFPFNQLISKEFENFERVIQPVWYGRANK